MLTVAGLRKSYETPQGRIDVLRGVDLSLDAGETLALTGDSGSGKSTLLHLIGALDAPDSGSIKIDGREIVGLTDAERAALRRSRIGMVFQQFNLIPSLTVDANLSFQARIADRDDPEWRAALVERLGLGDTLARYPEQLSGGQQQRVAIGRALAARPALLLADEPTGNLDEAAGDSAIALMRGLASETGAAILMATHSLARAATLDGRRHLARGVLAAHDAVAQASP